MAHAQTFSKTETIEYHDDTTNWVLGQVKRTTANGIETATTTYDVATALPTQTTSFGKVQQTMGYDTTSSVASGQRGTLKTVTDGNSKTTTLLNWKRGIPQTIQFPATTDQPSGVTKSAVVNDQGWIDSVTDENGYGYTTSYTYDAMGRLASIVYPTGDSTSWTTTTMSFTGGHPAAYGLGLGHWRQTISTGNARSITYFDAMWRPVVKETYDNANTNATLTQTVTRYDADGNTVFASYPQRTLNAAIYNTWGDPAQTPNALGTYTFYDALDRVIRTEQDTELGARAITSKAYNGIWVTTTNPRLQQSVVSHVMYDQPSFDVPWQIVEAYGTADAKYTDIYRNTLDKPTQLVQRNLAGTQSVSRYYVYDSNQQLCKTIEPETGATVLWYDAANNPTGSAAGLTGGSYSSTATCSQTEGASSGRRVIRTYDARNRLKTLVFPDGNGNQEWRYYPDSAPSQLTSWNIPTLGAAAKQIVNTYVYNRRRLLTTESLALEGWWTFNVGYGYDGNGSLASNSYPSGQTVSYLPNALGQPTQAGSYATGVSYHPNGGIASFTYGNGIVHTMTPNARQLPASSIDSGGVLNHQYSYDANANVLAIGDLAQGATYSRSMTYDNLDRLKTTTSPMFGGDGVHRFTYDALDNLKSWTLAGVKDYANYYYEPGTNRLTLIQNTAGQGVVGIGYDVQGNLANKDGIKYRFDYGNRLREVYTDGSVTPTPIERYRYDVHGRRALASRTTGPADTLGVIFSQYASNGQLMFQRNDRPGVSKDIDQIYLGGSLVAQRETPSGGGTATIKYQHTDALGSPVAVSSSAGALLERIAYEPYGKVIGGTPKDGPGYTGHVLDAATGMNYMQQRYYDPGIGRFLSRDPVTANPNTGANFNAYWYGNNNPYKFTDPDGRQACQTCKDFVEQIKSEVTKYVAQKTVQFTKALAQETKQAVQNHLKNNTYSAQVGVSGTIAAPLKNGTSGPSTAVTGGVNLAVNNHGQVSLTGSAAPMLGQGGGAAAGVTYGVAKSEGGASPSGFSTSMNHHAEASVSLPQVPISAGGSYDWSSQGGGFSAGSVRYGAGTIIFAGAGEQGNITYTFNEGLSE